MKKKLPRRIINDNPQPVSIGNGVHRDESLRAILEARLKHEIDKTELIG